MLNEYKDAEDKSSPDAQPSQNLVDELSSFSDKTIFDDPHLQELNIILNSFICCRDLYADWLNSSQEFAKSSVTCENKESSNKLIEDYLSQTNQYYNNHIKSVDAVLSVDEAVNDSLGLFIQIFEPYTKEYETVIDNLESINN